MSSENFPLEFLRLLRSVQARRPKTVIDHILEHGQITTEELRDIYGYNHPPRAIRDVREHGIPIEQFRVIGSDGRRIAAYRFGDPSEVRNAQLSGRTIFSAGIKAGLLARDGARCNIYLEQFPERELQIDHRIPFEIAGDNDLTDNLDDYMLLCASANRAKSWSCQNCDNWQIRDVSHCQSCYWAYPDNYIHIAMRDIRRLDILWSGEESSEYEKLREVAESAQETMPGYVKNVIRRFLEQEDSV